MLERQEPQTKPSDDIRHILRAKIIPPLKHTKYCDLVEVMLGGVCGKYAKTVNVFVCWCVGWGLHHLSGWHGWLRGKRLAGWLAGWL